MDKELNALEKKVTNENGEVIPPGNIPINLKSLLLLLDCVYRKHIACFW